jgi:hypothetical protein
VNFYVENAATCDFDGDGSVGMVLGEVFSIDV